MPDLLSAPWPWWIGGPALAAVALLIWVVERRLLGVSGSYRRLTTRESSSEREVLEALNKDPTALSDAMMQAAIDEFGEEAVELFGEAASEERSLEDERKEPAKTDRLPGLPQAVHLTFLGSLLLGGLVGALVSGGPSVDWSLGAAHESFFGHGAWSFVVLFVGGMCIGFGTRMAGGCTSGHGLVGCSRLQAGSLLATASFFGLGVVASFALTAIAGAMP